MVARSLLSVSQDSDDFGGAPSARTRVRRGAPRAHYGREDVLGILDAGLIAHVGVTTPDGPLVLPMAYGRDDDRIYLHGAAANHLLNTGDGHEVCVTVTHLDGLVMARTPFHNSIELPVGGGAGPGHEDRSTSSAGSTPSS